MAHNVLSGPATPVYIVGSAVGLGGGAVSSSQIGYNRLFSVNTIDVKQIGVTKVYTVPEGFRALFVDVMVRTVAGNNLPDANSSVSQVTMGSNEPYYNDWYQRPSSPSDNGWINGSYDQIGLVNKNPSDNWMRKLYEPGDEIYINVSTPTEADYEIWSLDAFGYLLPA